ncbi:MAG: FAD-binding protein [Thermoplasmata archaeon]|nr:FAD-binding protein [Thermoplasmata archaeon]
MKLIKGYPEYMWESIEKVEETREERLKSTIPRMSLEEREEILRKFHPDYKEGTKREVRIGPNKGDVFYNEIVDLLESKPLIDPDEIDLSSVDYDVDILIIGGGGAGTVAALWAYESGIPKDNILIVTKLRHGDSNSMMAQGGIQAADRPEDSPVIHFLDAYGGGHFTNKPELVKALVMDAPFIIKWHEELGVMYDRDENGEFIEISGGGTSRFRLHAAKDYTGMEIMRVLREKARNIGIPVLEFTSVIELLMDDRGRVAGGIAVNMETQEYIVIRAKATILATGGSGRLHLQNFPTTNHYGATGDGLVLAYRVGAKLRDLDAAQYHPTGAVYPEALVGLLCTEKLRGFGAVPVNKDGETFVHPLEPRDVESAAYIRECYERNKGVETPTGLRGIWLDTPMIEEIHGEGTIDRYFAAMKRQFGRFDIDISKQPILVFPTLHYQNGGVEIDEYAQTSVPGLFAAGEVTGGVHGKNRLMGNSLLDYNVFGRRAGIYAAKYVKKVKLGKLSLEHVRKYVKMLEEAGIKTDRKAPILLPDYRGKKALSRALDIF